MTREGVHVLVVADTHLGPTQAQRLIERLPRALPRADVIVHAGDVVDQAVLDALAEHAPVHAVLGNNDLGMVLPTRLVVPIAGCQIAMIHDSGPATGRDRRLLRWFPTADVVVFGHSHIPWHQTITTDNGHVQHHVNPGSAMQRRRQPRCTAAWLHLAGGHVLDVSHVVVPDEA